MHLSAYLIAPCLWWIALINLIKSSVGRLAMKNIDIQSRFDQAPASSSIISRVGKGQLSCNKDLTPAITQRCRRFLCFASLSIGTGAHSIPSWYLIRHAPICFESELLLRQPNRGHQITDGSQRLLLIRPLFVCGVVYLIYRHFFYWINKNW